MALTAHELWVIQANEALISFTSEYKDVVSYVLTGHPSNVEIRIDIRICEDGGRITNISIPYGITLKVTANCELIYNNNRLSKYDIMKAESIDMLTEDVLKILRLVRDTSTAISKLTYYISLCNDPKRLLSLKEIDS